MIPESEHLRFGHWRDLPYRMAELLWGDPQVTALISASGVFSETQIRARYESEIHNEQEYGIQYWPLTDKESGELVGVCGLRPHPVYGYELGFHLRPSFWGKGLAVEAAQCVIRYAFEELQAETLFAGHNPKNLRSKRVLEKLGFEWIGEEYYEPTGLMHPSYVKRNEKFSQK